MPALSAAAGPLLTGGGTGREEKWRAGRGRGAKVGKR